MLIENGMININIKCESNIILNYIKNKIKWKNYGILLNSKTRCWFKRENNTFVSIKIKNANESFYEYFFVKLCFEYIFLILFLIVIKFL